jgi:gas vesicle protein
MNEPKYGKYLNVKNRPIKKWNPYRWENFHKRIPRKNKETNKEKFIRLSTNRLNNSKFAIDKTMKLVSIKNGKNYKFENQNEVMIDMLNDLKEYINQRIELIKEQKETIELLKKYKDRKKELLKQLNEEFKNEF